jgi:hypothetical protein
MILPAQDHQLEMIQNNIFRWSSWQIASHKSYSVPFYLLIIFIGVLKKDQPTLLSLNTSIKRYATANNIPMLIITGDG